MAFGDTDKDAGLLKAWHAYCDELKKAADDLFRDPFRVTNVNQRAEAFRYLTQAVTMGLVWHIENEPMKRHPWLHQCFGPLMKQAGDKSMAKEYGAYVEPGCEYRIRGERGSVRWLVFTALRQADPADPMSSKQNWQEPWALFLDSEPLLGKELVIEPDGTFEIICSEVRPAGAKNWLQLSPQAMHIRIRTLFSDWNKEEAARMWIERIGGEVGGAPPPLLSPEQIEFGLAKAAMFARKSTAAWGPPPLEGRVENEMANRPLPPSKVGGIDGNPGGVMAVAWWALKLDEALVLEFEPLQSLMWSIEVENAWWCTPDYRWRLVEVTDSQAAIEDDGTCRVVVAHSDPGVPNWLDTGSWPEGWVRYRGTLSEGMRGPQWTSRVVKLSELSATLPTNAKRIDAAGRKQQVQDRVAGVRRRWC